MLFGGFALGGGVAAAAVAEMRWLLHLLMRVLWIYLWNAERGVMEVVCVM